MKEEDIAIPDDLFEEAMVKLSVGKPNVRKNNSPKAINLWFDKKRFYVELDDGRLIRTPLFWFPRLMDATQKQRDDWEIDTGTDIHWEEIDEDILVEDLL